MSAYVDLTLSSDDEAPALRPRASTSRPAAPAQSPAAAQKRGRTDASSSASPAKGAAWSDAIVLDHSDDERPAKRARVVSQADHGDAVADDEPLEAFLARIAAAERSSPGKPAATSSAGPVASSSRAAIAVYDSDDGIEHVGGSPAKVVASAVGKGKGRAVEPAESDEAMARRMQAELNAEPASVDRNGAAPASSPDELLRTLKTALDSLIPRGKTHAKCSSCDKGLPAVDRKIDLTSSSDRLEKLIVGLVHVRCASCSTVSCAGCVERLGCSSVCKSRCAGLGHCTAARLLVLLALLEAIDTFHLAQRQAAIAASAAKGKGRRKTGGGTGYGSGRSGYGAMATGGFGGFDGEEDEWDDGYDDEADYGMVFAGRGRGRGGQPKHNVDPTIVKRQSDQAEHAKRDRPLVAALELLARMTLPGPERDAANAFDWMPPDALGPLLLASQLFEVLLTALRNDSVEDAIMRPTFYHACLGVLSTLASSEATLPLLVQPRPDKASSVGLAKWLIGAGEITWERQAVAKPASSPKKYNKPRGAAAASTPAPAAPPIVYSKPIFGVAREAAAAGEHVRIDGIDGRRHRRADDQGDHAGRRSRRGGQGRRARRRRVEARRQRRSDRAVAAGRIGQRRKRGGGRGGAVPQSVRRARVRVPRRRRHHARPRLRLQWSDRARDRQCQGAQPRDGLAPHLAPARHLRPPRSSPSRPPQGHDRRSAVDSMCVAADWQR